MTPDAVPYNAKTLCIRKMSQLKFPLFPYSHPCIIDNIFCCESFPVFITRCLMGYAIFIHKIVKGLNNHSKMINVVIASNSNSATLHQGRQET